MPRCFSHHTLDSFFHVASESPGKPSRLEPVSSTLLTAGNTKESLQHLLAISITAAPAERSCQGRTAQGDHPASLETALTLHEMAFYNPLALFGCAPRRSYRLNSLYSVIPGCPKWQQTFFRIPVASACLSINLRTLLRFRCLSSMVSRNAGNSGASASE
jgi:hypothetical protein